METLTSEQIGKMTPPQLRKAVKDAGADPGEIGNADPVELRKWLTSKHAPPPKANAKKLSPPPPPTAAVTPPKKSAPKAEPTEERSWREQIEMRLAMLEEKAGISQGTARAAPASPPADPYPLLRKYIREGEDGAVFFELPHEEIQTLTEPQLNQIAPLLDLKFEDGLPVRIKRQRVAVALEKLHSVGEEAPAAEPEIMEPGNVVSLRKDGKVYDPCVITDVLKPKRGGKLAYDVFIDATQEDTRVSADAVIGRSDKQPEHYE